MYVLRAPLPLSDLNH